MTKIIVMAADSGLVTPHEDENIPSSSSKYSHQDWSPSGQSGGLRESGIGEGLIQPSSNAESPFIYNRSAPKQNPKLGREQVNQNSSDEEDDIGSERKFTTIEDHFLMQDRGVK